MQLTSVNVGLPREVSWKGKTISTGIFKEPVANVVKLRSLNLDGDRQADLSVHGGVDKAVYAYPSEHYSYWQRELPDMQLPWGMFGENFTTTGLFEDEVFIGDRFQIGTAEVMATQPRLPCYKLGIKFGRADIVQRFQSSRLTGIYFSVLREGEVQVGNTIELIERNQTNISISDITRLYLRESDSLEMLDRAVRLESLPIGWRNYFRNQIAKRSGQNSDS
jgi:MOSC domain-containing protein YiiM